VGVSNSMVVGWHTVLPLRCSVALVTEEFMRLFLRDDPILTGGDC